MSEKSKTVFHHKYFLQTELKFLEDFGLWNKFTGWVRSTLKSCAGTSADINYFSIHKRLTDELYTNFTKNNTKTGDLLKYYPI